MTAVSVQRGPESAAALPERRPARRFTGWPLRVALIALAVAAVLSAVFPGTAGPARTPLVIGAALLVPGAALLGLLPRQVLRAPAWPVWLGMSFALSCAVQVAGTTIMAWTHLWYPDVWLLAVAGAGILGLALPRTAATPEIAPRRPAVGSLGVVCLLACAAGLWALSLREITLTGLTDLGLPPRLPVAWYGALALAVAAAVAAALAGRSAGLAAVAVGVLVLILFGTVPALGVAPQYSWVYKHIGVVQYIELHHGTDLTGDIYQRWPGFFAATAAIAPASGRADPAAFAGWAEPLFALADALLVAALARALRFSRSICWGAALVFTVADWIGQTYFSPQALAFTLMLAFFVLLLQRRVPTGDRPLVDRVVSRVVPRRARRWSEQRGGPTLRAVWPSPSTIGLLVLLQACISVSHQLTPYLLVIGLVLLSLATPLRPRWLWPVVAAVPLLYLIPNFDFVQRNFGVFTSFDIFNNVQHDQTYMAVVSAGKALNAATSQVLSVTVWVTAVLALLVGLRSRHPAVRILGPLFVSPFFLVLGQDYGGEASLRVFLFSLPWAAVAISAAMLGFGRRLWTLCWAALSVLLVALFVPSFFGQAELNIMPRDEVQASATIYRIGRPGGVLMLAGPNFPRAYSGEYGKFGFSAADDIPSLLETPYFRERPLGSGRDVDEAIAMMQSYSRYGFLVFASSETVYSNVFGLTQPGQLGALERAIASDPRFTLVLRSPNVRVYGLGDAVEPGVSLPVQLPPGG